MGEPLQDLRVADILTFLAVRRCGSVSGAARELKVTPSQVSKALDRLEKELGQPLVRRTGRGITMSDEANLAGPILEDVVSRLRLVRRKETAALPVLTCAGPTYLMTVFLPAIAAALPKRRFRAVELAPAHMRAFATERLYDIALSLGRERLPEAWISQSVGELTKGLFAPPALAKRLKPFPAPVERIAECSFVMPVYFANGQLAPGDDDCPLRVADRRIGHEVGTVGLALEMAARTEQLVFGPSIAAREHVMQGRLVPVPVEGWNISEALHIACHADRVLAPVQQTIVRALRSAVEALSRPH